LRFSAVLPNRPGWQMKIAINGLSARFGGGAAYLKNLLEHLSKIDHENQYIVFTSPEKRGSFRADAANFSVIAPRFPGRAIVRRTIWEQLVLPVLIRRYRIDILFSPGGIAPVIVPGHCRRVNMVQNMAPFSDELLVSYPLNKRKVRFLILRKLYPLFAASADANIFISMDGLKTLRRAAKFDRKSEAEHADSLPKVEQAASLSKVEHAASLFKDDILLEDTHNSLPSLIKFHA
jgi:hypothetical protein